MRKILLFTAFMLMLSLVITAQTNFGLKAGVNHASLYTYINKQSHKIGPMERLHFGASLDVHVSKTVSILTEANFNQLGASDKNSESEITMF
ncbi:MAG: hypothetical protein HYX40_07605 [Sphingobacteriales bacterium]|nr:hypothetical protein [Sphingobacteriales bacterium]